MDSPCHECPKCPCKEHDTCEKYQEYRGLRLAVKKKKEEERAAVEATVFAVRRCKRKR